MLSKLLKYEFKSTSRIMWLLYLGLIGVAILLGIVFRVADFTGVMEYGGGASMYIDEEAINTVIKTLMIFLGISYFLVLNAVIVITTIMIVLRFYKNILCDEGYLMHTLPVSTTNLIVSKLLISFIWVLLGIASVIISACAFMVTSGMLGGLIREGELVRIFKEVFEAINFGSTALFIVSFVISVVSGILMFYLSMAIGNLANKNKFLFSVLAFLGIQTVLSIVSAIIIGVGGFSILENIESGREFFNIFYIITIVLNGVIGAGCFFGTDWLLKNKLNLA